MQDDYQNLAEEFIKLAFGIEEYLPGYVDAYFGPQEWKGQSQQDGKLPLQTLTDRTARLANDISHADGMDAQRKDFFARQVTAMQMSLRLLGGETVSLAEEVKAIYDVQPEWRDESNFEQAHRELDELLPRGDSLVERKQAWDRSLEISLEKAKELIPLVINKLQDITRRKFGLPENESFDLEWVSDKPWAAYNWYKGSFRSLIEINQDLPKYVNGLAGLIAHEGYPGHHTELSNKEQKLVRQKNYYEHTIALINSPSCVIAEGIATSALEAVMTDAELEDWYREEILPRAGMSHIDPARILQINHAFDKTDGIMGNLSFMLYDQHKSTEEAEQYLGRYSLATEQVIKHLIRFVSDPLSRSYVFTYDMGHDLLKELFTRTDRREFFKRILEEPVTPSQIRQWIANAR
jgi:hypothetical protein